MEERGQTPEEETEMLRRFVLDWCDGHIFSDRHMDDLHHLPMVFMVLAFGGKDAIPKDAALVYEHVSAAERMSINGMPTFFSCRFLTQAQCERVFPAIRAELARRAELKV